MSSILAIIESIWQTDEQWVLTCLVKLKAGVAILEKDLKNALTWIASHAQEITDDVQSILKIVQASGLSITPAVQKAIDDANAAVAAVNAIAASVNAGQTTGQTLIGAYVATKTAQVSTADAAVSIATSDSPATKA